MGKKLPLVGKSITLGRHQDNVLALNDDLASRFHAVVEPHHKSSATGSAKTSYRLRDLGSRNGTLCNREKIEQVDLKHGDVFSVGAVVFRYIDPSMVAKPKPAPSASLDDTAIAPQSVGRAHHGTSGDCGASGGGDDDPYAAIPLEGDDDEDDASRGASGGNGRSGAGRGNDDGEDPFAAVLIEDEGGNDYGLSGLDDQPTDPIERLRELIATTHATNRTPVIEENALSLISARGTTVHEATGRGEKSDSSETLRLIRLLLIACIHTRATDLHLEPKSSQYIIRLRVDGSMIEAVELTREQGVQLASLVKVVADIDISQKSVIQEGHFTSAVPGRRIDYRVSFTPAMHGQKMVLRVLDLANAPQHTSDLDLPDWMNATLRRVSKQDAGMVLVCGPTGSGKTTTLYALLRDIDVNVRNVITIEDPVEYHIENVTQIPIDEKQGNTFHTLLRSCLRQDPDVILLDEIRDQETAQTAMQAAMTGHLVLSTTHAKDTLGAVFRLLDLGVEPYLVASALNIVIAQRLIRLLCPHCKVSKVPTPGQTMKLGQSVEGVSKIYVPGSCSRCLGTGFLGRRAVFELLQATDDLRDVIIKQPTLQTMREAVKMTMFRSLQQSGYRHVLDGTTSIDEIERVTGME